MEENRDNFDINVELPKYSLDEVLEEAKGIELLPAELDLYAAEMARMEHEPEPEPEIPEELPQTNVTQILILPEDPEKRERAEQILRSVEKEVGNVATPAALIGIELEPDFETDKPRKQRAGDIIRNILPDIVQQDKKSDPIGRREARRERERAERERKRAEREEILRAKSSRAEEETRILRELFFQPEPEDDDEMNSTIRIPVITEEMLDESAANEVFEQENKQDRDEDANEVLARYASKVDNLRMLSYGAMTACILMLLYTLALELGWKLPSAFIDNVTIRCAIFLALQLIVMVFGSGILLTGLYDIFKLRINTESAVVLLAFFSLCDTVRILIGGGYVGVGAAVPLALPSSVAIVFAMMGTRLGKSGFSRTIKAVKAMDKPVAVKAEYKRVNKGLVLSKSTASSRGFFFSLTRVDTAEQRHSVYTPLALVGIIVLAVLSCLYNRQPHELLRSVTVIGCGAAVLTPLWAFNAPFAKISRILARRKAALGGWTGAENITEARNVLFRDNDLFRVSRVSLSSFKFERGVKSDIAMQYAGSIALEANCGLTPVFNGLLKENGIVPAEVTGFEVREGGGLIGFINDRRVILASDRFVKLNDISTMSLPVGIPGAVYLIVDGLAVAVFILQYSPSDKVQKLLLRLERTAIQPLLATRDFNITPAMIREKFKIDLKDIELLPYPERFALASDYADEKVKPIALLANDDMGVLTEVTESAVWLHKRVRLASTLSLVFSIVGMLLMFYTCFNGGANGVYSHRLFLYQLITWAFTMALTMVGRK